MRSGATQQSPSFPAKVTATVDGDVYTDSDRLLRAYEDEQIWGGNYIIELDNADDALSAKDYEGKGIVINNSFQSEAGSNLATLWVHSQAFSSKEGELRLVLNCIDIWTLLAATNATVGAEYWNFPEQAPGEPNEDASHYDKTIFQIITALADTVGVTVDLDDDDGIINTQKPPIRITNARTGIRQLMEMTKSYLLWKSDGKFHVIQPDAHATVYSYNTLDLFFSNVTDEGITIPNRIIYYGTDSEGDVISGNAVDNTSYTRLGMYIDRHYFGTRNEIRLINAEATLTALAQGTLAKVQGERNQGLLIAPMHCGQELYDKVSVTDSRYDTPKTTTGYVHRIIREYDRGVYRITLFLGGVATGYTTPGGAPALGLASLEDSVSLMPDTVYPWQLWTSVQPYVCDLDFTAIDKNHISWASGSIEFKDGTSLDIDSNASLYLSAAGWLYFTEGSATLTFTTTFADVVAPTHGLVAFVAPGLETGATALILPAAGKEPLLNADIITCIHLSSISAHIGDITAGTIQGVTITVTGTGQFLIKYDGDTKGHIDGLSNGMHLLGQNDVLMSVGTDGGITISAGGTVSVTDDDLMLAALRDIVLDAGDDLNIEVYDEMEILCGDRFSLGTGGLDPTPTLDDIILSAEADMILGANTGEIILADDTITDDIDAESTLKDIGSTTEFDEIYCDTLYYNGGSLPDDFDDLGLIKLFRNDSIGKLDMASIPEMFKLNKEKVLAKSIAKIDAKHTRMKARYQEAIDRCDNWGLILLDKELEAKDLPNKEAGDKEKRRASIKAIQNKFDALAFRRAVLVDKEAHVSDNREELIETKRARAQYLYENFIPVNSLVALSLGGIKQLTAKVESLEEKIERLEARIGTLENV